MCSHYDNVLQYGQAAHSTSQSQTCVPLKGSEAKCVHPHALVQQQAVEKHPWNSEQAWQWMMPAEFVVRTRTTSNIELAPHRIRRHMELAPHRTRTTPYSQTYVPLSIQPLDGKRSVFVFGQGQLLGYTSARARAETRSWKASLTHFFKISAQQVE